MLPKPKNQNAAQWLEAVAEEGGLLAALPNTLWPTGAVRSQEALQIGRLSGVVGAADFWAQTRPREGDGFEEWFPEGHDYDASISSLEWDKITLAGITFQQFDENAVLLQLEAAARGVAPAIFAHFVRGGGYTQLHSFLLDDMLRAYTRLLGDPLRRPSRGNIEATIYEATMGIARKVRELADVRILKLNMTTKDVVFCPKLYEADDGTLEENGYSFDGLQSIKGIPYLTGFKADFCKKVPLSTSGYDTDAAYLLMMLVFLADVKAAHGHATCKLMMHKLLGRTTGGADLPVDGLPPDFERLGLREVSMRIETTNCIPAFCATLKMVMASNGAGEEGSVELAKDLNEIQQTKVLQSLWRGSKPHALATRKMFAAFVGHLQESTEAATDLFNPTEPATETLDALERTHLVERRLLAVIEARAANVRQTSLA